MRPANFTRQTADLAAKFRRNGQWHLLALYHLLQWSDFSREGIARSGSYRFADHLYRNEASGRGWFGRWLDRRMLNLPSARGMRGRYLKAIEELERELKGRSGPLRMLALPCGIPRDVSELAFRDPAAARRIEYTGMDLDPEVVLAAREHLAGVPLKSAAFLEGNALEATSYPEGKFDFIVSTGLGEFLPDEELGTFYRNVFEALTDGGVFFTSATDFEKRSDFMMRAFEMKAHYRGRGQLERILRLLPWRELVIEKDETGLQSLVRGVK
ncbi:MAG: hypothetical protein JWO82_3472 [Akkermansiaceae bacterium]|nr:hypothetical protein [Akkermansiaceae bacterium]